MSDWLGEQDRMKRDLEERFPGWGVWFVPGMGRTVTWCARPMPLLNEDSPEHLAEAIEQSGITRKDNNQWLP